MALVVGAVTSIAVPVLVGTLVGTFGLSALLLATAAVALVVGLVLLTRPVHRRVMDAAIGHLHKRHENCE